MIWKLLKDEDLVNTIVADKAFAMLYAEDMGYTAELVEESEAIIEPTELEQLRADIDFIAMETGVEL